MTSFELASSHTRVTSTKSTQRHGVIGQLVSLWQGLPTIGLGSDKNNQEFYEDGNELGMAMNKDEKNEDDDELGWWWMRMVMNGQV